MFADANIIITSLKIYEKSLIKISFLEKNLRKKLNMENVFRDI